MSRVCLACVEGRVNGRRCDWCEGTGEATRWRAPDVDDMIERIAAGAVECVQLGFMDARGLREILENSRWRDLVMLHAMARALHRLGVQ